MPPGVLNRRSTAPNHYQRPIRRYFTILTFWLFLCDDRTVHQFKCLITLQSRPSYHFMVAFCRFMNSDPFCQGGQPPTWTDILYFT
jgi:hypothetical protein